MQVGVWSQGMKRTVLSIYLFDAISITLEILQMEKQAQGGKLSAQHYMVKM